MCFDHADGSKPTQETAKTGTLATPPQQNPQRESFQFDGWTYNGQPFDFQTPILQNTTLKAQWSKITDWTLSPDHGPATGARLTISPPSPQEPYYTGIQAAGEQTVGLTGDGRIYTWAQDGTPKQVPSPAQAPDGFHYLQAAAGSRRQAALGSDHRIYTWSSQEDTPSIIDTGQDAGFTSISINNDRLLAVDRQGQVHTYQASRNPNPRFIEQAATSLPGKTQAVTTIATDNRILTLDSDGQAWTWDASNTGNIKPAHIKQDTTIRIIQAQALNQGLLLLDTDGHTYYQADGKSSITAVSLPEGMKASRITANKDQAMIVGKDGHVWAWKPGEAPKRADKAGQQFVQATAAGNRITAISRQGDIYKWSLDEQGQPGKPARLDTVSEPTLETVSMDGQPLTLSMKERSWQTETPAHKPGQATILIAGRQDGQPFTRSLTYTVDQPLTRDDQQGTTHTVTFNADGGHPEPGDQQVSYPYGRVQRPSPDPSRDGYQFDGWFTGEVAYDFSKPVTENLTLTAKWTRQDPKNTWSINPDKGSQFGNETTTITPPTTTSSIKFNQVSDSNSSDFSLAVGSDGNAYAWGSNYYGQLGDGTTTQRNTPVPVLKPAGVSADFTYVQVSAGNGHSLAVGSDGYVYAWGGNDYGELGNGTANGYGEKNPVPTRVRGPSTQSNASKGLKAVEVSAGYLLSLAIDAKGTTWAWGLNDFGQLGNGSSIYSSSTPVRVCDPNDKWNSDKGLQSIQVSAGLDHSLAIDAAGNIWAWGWNRFGELGNGSSGSWVSNPVPQKVLIDPYNTSTGLEAVQISAGYEFSLAVGKDGNIWAWGLNDSGQLGNGTTSEFETGNPVPQKVVLNPKDASTAHKATQVSAGRNHSLVLDSDGYVYAWGLNGCGEIGDNTTNTRATPVKVFASEQSTNKAGPWLSATLISGGQNHSLAIDTDGNTKAWGDNNTGQLGNPNAGWQSLTPVPVVLNLQPVITGVTFDSSAATGLTHSTDNSFTMTTPAHLPGTVTVSVDYTLGGAGRTLTDKSLTYTYLPVGVLPKAGGEGILLALATGMTGMGGVLASRRHRKETHQLSHASRE